MRNFMRNIVAAVGIALSVLSVASLSAPVAFAQPVPLGQRSFSPRLFPTQQLHYTRFVFNFNSCVLAAGACNLKVATVPYNAFILRATQQVVTAFNSATTDTVALGTSAGGAQLVAAQSVHAAGGGTALTIVAANVGVAATGAGIAQTGTLGGFDIWVAYAQTGAAPTAGQAVYVIEWAAPNDGSCTQVPLGATAGAC